jgi:hypothetical protein
VKIVLFVEGHTEKKALPAFLRRWLDSRLPTRVGVKSVRFEGWSEYVDDIAKKVNLNLTGRAGEDVVGAIGLLDLYGPTFYPNGATSVHERYQWAKVWLEKKVGNARFRQHFAVHETQAWLLADRSIFPAEVRSALSARSQQPETINFNEPPASLLGRIYQDTLGRGYRKVTDGANLFADLDPATAAGKCPYLAGLLADLLAMAQEAQRG